MRAVATRMGIVLRRAGIDRAVGFTVLGRGWAAIAGILTLALMTRYLSPVEQGYYFTFASVLALSIFFELGLSVVLIQFASHERVALEWTPSGTLSGDATAKARLSSLLRMSLKWYSAAGALLAITVLPLGLIFFSISRHGSADVSWQIPWIWSVLVTSLTVALTPALAILEGCGLIAQIARVQLWQGIGGSLLLWLALAAHWGLYTAPITATVTLVCQIGWLWTQKRMFFSDLLHDPASQGGGKEDKKVAPLDWRGEVWPLQWKIGLSYIGGYLIFRMFNPILFATHGPIAAGQMGMCLTVYGTITTISIAWVTTKASPFGRLIAGKDYVGLDHMFFPCLWQSWALVAVISAAVWGLALGLHLGHFPISHRFLAPLPLGLLAMAAVVNHGVFAEAIYLRAHKQEPFLVLGIVVALLVALSGLLLAKPFGATGMMVGYFVVSVLTLALATRIFAEKRRDWHSLPVTSTQI